MLADKPVKRPMGLVGLIVIFPGRHHTHDSDGGSLRNAADTAGELEHVVIGLPDTYEEGLNVSGRQLGGGLLSREPFVLRTAKAEHDVDACEEFEPAGAPTRASEFFTV